MARIAKHCGIQLCVRVRVMTKRSPKRLPPEPTPMATTVVQPPTTDINFAGLQFEVDLEINPDELKRHYFNNLYALKTILDAIIQRLDNGGL